MSQKSSSRAGWWSTLEPAPAEVFYRRGDTDDPRLGDVVRRWEGGPVALPSGSAILIGFLVDEGVRRNQGRPGAAQAPDAIRAQLYRLTTWDQPAGLDLAEVPLLDLGNVRGDALESAQDHLGTVVAEVLRQGARPIILGGGHETAYGHFLGYRQAGLRCAILNIDAHLDVRPYPHGGHSGSPFRQALEDETLPPAKYVVLGAQRQSVARAHVAVVKEHGGRIHWHEDDARALKVFQKELGLLGNRRGNILLTVDADAFRQGDVPGTSAPSPVGFAGALWPQLALLAGRSTRVTSLDLVEVNPLFDRDHQTARWAALGIRQFLVGMAGR